MSTMHLHLCTLPMIFFQYTRDKIFECMLVAPDIIRRQLKEVVKTMIQENFPEAFPDFKENILSVCAPLFVSSRQLCPCCPC